MRKSVIFPIVFRCFFFCYLVKELYRKVLQFLQNYDHKTGNNFMFPLLNQNRKLIFSIFYRKPEKKLKLKYMIFFFNRNRTPLVIIQVYPILMCSGLSFATCNY